MNPVHGRTASKLKFLKPDFIPLHAFLILISSFLSPPCCCGLNARSRSILTWKKLILKPEMYTSSLAFYLYLLISCLSKLALDNRIKYSSK